MYRRVYLLALVALSIAGMSYSVKQLIEPTPTVQARGVGGCCFTSRDCGAGGSCVHSDQSCLPYEGGKCCPSHKKC